MIKIGSLICTKILLLIAMIFATSISLTQSSSEMKNFQKRFELAQKYSSQNINKTDSIISILKTSLNSQPDSVVIKAEMFFADFNLMKGDKEYYYSKLEELKNRFWKSDLHKNNKQLFLRYIHLLIYQKDYVTAKELVSKELSKNLRRNTYEYNTLLHYISAILHMHTNDRENAMRLIDKSVLYARRSNDRNLLAEIYHQQGVIYNHFGQLDMVVAKNQIALQLVELSSNLSSQCKYNYYIGVAQMEIRNYFEAEKYFNKAIEVASRVGLKKYQALSYMYLGVIDARKDDFSLAISKITNSIEMLSTINDEDGLGISNYNLGDIYLKQKKYSLALNRYNQALVYFESTGNKINISRVYQKVGTVFESQEKYNNALNYFNRSLEIRKLLGYKDGLSENYKSISEVYRKIGNINLAYQYLKLYTLSADSSKFYELSSKIAELNQSYRSAQREQLILSQADSLEKQKQETLLTNTKLENIELKNQMKNYVIIGFVLLLVLGGIIVFYNSNQSRIKQQQEQAEMNQTLLRSQMNPHFVFNAMSVIQSYIYDNDTKNSSRFLVKFSQLMRLILENSSKDFISIELENQILERYLEVQKMRFEDRFDFEIFIEERLYHDDAVIPPMIMQPFIENSIEHGQLHLKTDGFINIHVYKEDEMLRILIEDNGIGIKKSSETKVKNDHKSLAMKITKERIENLNKRYRSNGFVKIEPLNSVDNSGTRVILALPYKTKNEINE